MTDGEFSAMLTRTGYMDTAGRGPLHHWPSGKLFRPMDYYEIKTLVEAALAEGKEMNDSLPPLPLSDGVIDPGSYGAESAYTADTLRAYAEAAIALRLGAIESRLDDHNERINILENR